MCKNDAIQCARSLEPGQYFGGEKENKEVQGSMKALGQLKIHVPTWMNFTSMNFTLMPAFTLDYISSKTVLLF